MKYLKLWENLQDENYVAQICQKYKIKNWSINSEGLVDVDGDVNFIGYIMQTYGQIRFRHSHGRFDKIPIRFGRVTGDFTFTGQSITTLEGAPQRVDGTFDCSRNPKLTSLQGIPKSCYNFICSETAITTLEVGYPFEVTNYFKCYGNHLTSLKGAPKKIKGDFNVNRNKLTSLIDGPQECGSFICSQNLLTSLEYGPKKVQKEYLCGYNQLESLYGAPDECEYFDCRHNPITSLKYSPKKTIQFDCSFCNLTTLEGCAEIVENFKCLGNSDLKSYKGGPEIVNAKLEISKNRRSFESFPKMISGKPSSEWIINQLNKPYEFRIIYVSELWTLPDYVLSPKLLSIIRQKYPKQYLIIKNKQQIGSQWATDLQADAGEYGL